MAKKTFECNICGYKTSRKFNLELHKSKKIPCKIKENITESSIDNIIVNPEGLQSVNSVNLLNESVHKCEICGKVFNTRQGKYKHKKNVKCLPVEEKISDPDNLMKEVARLKKENELLKTNNTSITTNNNNNITNTVNDNSVTTNNTIIYNNYNKPYTGHISKQTMIDIYNECKSEMSMMIYSLVKKIYKDHPENDCIKFPEGIKSGFAEVQYNDKKCILPVNEVLETVLTKTTSVGKKNLMKAYENDDVIGHNMEDILDEMSTLSLNFRNEKEHRGLHLPYVKSALLS